MERSFTKNFKFKFPAEVLVNLDRKYETLLETFRSQSSYSLQYLKKNTVVANVFILKHNLLDC